MNRPLVYAAVLLALGIYIFSFREDKGQLWGPLPPELRLQMEAAEAAGGDPETEGSFSFTVDGIRKDQDRFVISGISTEGLGTVMIYVPADLLPSGREILPGYSVSMKGSLFLFPEARNPGAFDTRAYYDHLRIYFGLSAKQYEIRKDRANVLKSAVYRFSLYLGEQIDRFAGEDAGYFKSLLLGTKHAMTPEEEDPYEDLGVRYLILVSGMTVSLIGSFFYAGLRKILKFFPAAVLSFLPVLLYVFLIGSGAAAVRAMIVHTVRVLAPVFRRSFDYLCSAALSLILLMAENPEIVFLSSFVYFLGAFIAFGILAPAINRFLFAYHRFYTPLIYLFSLQTVLLPVTLYFQYSCSLYSPVLSLLFLPLRGIMLGFIFLGALFGGISGPAAVFFFGAPHFIRVFLEFVLAAAGNLPFAVLVNGRPGILSLVLYGMLILGLILVMELLFQKNKGLPEKEEIPVVPKTYRTVLFSLMGIYVFGLCFLKAPSPLSGQGEIIMLDTGQGESILFRLPGGRNLLLDAGSSSDQDVYGNVLQDTLRYYGIGSLDELWLSHPDQDHVSAVLPMAEDGVRIRKLFVSQNALDAGLYETILSSPKIAERTDIEPVLQGVSTEYFRLLSPKSGSYGSGNEDSLVFLFSFGNFSALFTGDISENQENRISDLPDADLLKVAHHGSKTATGAAFLAKVRPEAAIISYGRRNAYGHPAPVTVEKLRARQTTVFGTGKNGAITVSFRENGSYEISPFLHNDPLY